MVVRTLGSGRGVTGLYIGPRNARRYFSRRIRHIELLLGHLHIYCDLPDAFWQGEPQICDPRLADWLFSRIFHGKAGRSPAPVALIRQGHHGFRVLPFTIPAASANAMTHIGPPHRLEDGQRFENALLNLPRSFVPNALRAGVARRAGI